MFLFLFLKLKTKFLVQVEGVIPTTDEVTRYACLYAVYVFLFLFFFFFFSQKLFHAS